jgi:hypothetical protein
MYRKLDRFSIAKIFISALKRSNLQKKQIYFTKFYEIVPGSPDSQHEKNQHKDTQHKDTQHYKIQRNKSNIKTLSITNSADTA